MAVTNALMKIGENALAKAGEKAVEKTATNALTKAGTGALTKLTMDAVLPQASRSALTSLLSPNSGFTSVLGRIADKNGTPLSLYHSTPYEFSRFDDSKLGTNTMYDNTAYGHFATPDKDFSSRFLDIDNTGQKGRTMELQAKIKNPITHPYGASAKYSGDELDNIVENYMLATGNGEGLDMLRNGAMEDGMSLYDEYMNATMDESPFELAKYERKDLMNKGYDGMEIVEGLKNDLVDGSKSKAPISSIVAFEGKNLSPVSHIPVQNMSSGAMDIPVESGVADRVSKYMSKPINVVDESTGALPVAVDTDAGVANLGQLANEESALIQHGDNRPDITRGSDLRIANEAYDFSNPHQGVMFSSLRGDTPVGSNGSDDYKRMFLGSTEGQKVLDITDPYNAQALERTLGVRGFADKNGEGMLEGIRNGYTEQLGDKGGVLGDLLKKNDIGFVKGNSGLDSAEYVAANNDAIQKAYAETAKRAEKYLEKPGATLQNLRVGGDMQGDGIVDAVASSDVNMDGVINKNDVKSIYAQAQKDQKILDKWGRQIAEKEKFPEYQDFAPKSIESMENKVKRKGGDYSLMSMKDHTRNKIMMNTWQDVPAVIADMEEMGLDPTIEFVINDWGYKGLHITGRYDDGLGWEIQLTTPEDWPRKLRSDAIYDKWRNVELDTASPQEVMGYLNAMRESKTMWSESSIPDLSKYDNTKAPVSGSDIEKYSDFGGYSQYSSDIERVGSKDVAPVDKSTLPAGYEQMKSIIGKNGEDATKRLVLEELGVEGNKNITKDMLKEFLDRVGYDSSHNTKAELWAEAKRYMQDQGVDSIYEEGGSSMADVVTARLGNKPWSKGKSLEQLYTGASGRTGRLDAEYSDRLGIGRSNTPMLDTLNGDSAAGDYWNGVIGTNPTWAEGESGVSTVAHERLHAMQHAQESREWDARVENAIEELRDELRPFLHDDETIRLRHGSKADVSYWGRREEQEARMLQSYLENEGYTNTGRNTEWGDEVKPAFDKFFEKLRELSKKGIALPAITALFGGGAMMAGGQKKEEG